MLVYSVMTVPVMSTVSLADHSLHVCSRQALLCVRLAACHVPLVLNYNHGTSCDEARWAYSGTPRRCIRHRRMANTIRSSCNMPWATRLYTVWEEGRSQLVSCLLHIHTCMCIHTIPHHIYSLHTHTWNRSRVMMLSLLPWSTIPFRLGFPLRTTWNISRKNRREYWYRKYTCGGEKSIIQ